MLYLTKPIINDACLLACPIQAHPCASALCCAGMPHVAQRSAVGRRQLPASALPPLVSSYDRACSPRCPVQSLRRSAAPAPCALFGHLGLLWAVTRQAKDGTSRWFCFRTVEWERHAAPSLWNGGGGCVFAGGERKGSEAAPWSQQPGMAAAPAGVRPSHLG
jgi:hypothetical protein